MAITRSRRNNKQVENLKNKLGNEKEEKFIVKSKESLLRRVVEFVISLLLWIPMLIVLYFFISACFNYNDSFLRNIKNYFKVTNNDIKYFMIISLICFCVAFLILFIWKMYNKKRFGALNRRREPGQTTDEEMLSLELVGSSVYNSLQNEKIIIFDKNPIRELSRGGKVG